MRRLLHFLFPSEKRLYDDRQAVVRQRTVRWFPGKDPIDIRENPNCQFPDNLQ